MDGGEKGGGGGREGERLGVCGWVAVGVMCAGDRHDCRWIRQAFDCSKLPGSVRTCTATIQICLLSELSRVPCVCFSGGYAG